MFFETVLNTVTINIMKGFKDIFCALNFCPVFEEVRQYFRMKNKMRGERCRLIASRIHGFGKVVTEILNKALM